MDWIHMQYKCHNWIVIYVPFTPIIVNGLDGFCYVPTHSVVTEWNDNRKENTWFVELELE